MHTRHKLLQDIADFAALGRIKDIQKAAGFNNDNYFITTHKGEYFIKINRKKFELKDKLHEQEYLERLQQYDFPAVSYYRSPSGDFIYQKNDELALIQEKVDGISPQESTNNIAGQIGSFLAQLHTIPIDPLPNKQTWMCSNYLADEILVLKKNFSDNTDVKEFIQLYQALNFRSDRLPQSLIHGDCFPENTLFKNEKLIAFIDWEDVCIGASILDFAIAVIGCCYKDDFFQVDIYNALYKGYTKIRPFTEGEEEKIEEAVRYVALTIAVWRFLYHNYYQPDEKLKNRFQAFWKHGLDTWQKP